MSKKKYIASRTWQTITSTISTTMVLVLMGLIMFLMLTANAIVDSVKENLTVTIVLDDAVQTADALRFKETLLEKPYVNDIEYISREQALQEHVESMGMDPTDFLGSNPFSISMEARMKADYSCNDSLVWITDELRHMSEVSDVFYQKDLVESLNHNLNRVLFILLVLASLLSVISLCLINNTVRLSIYAHRFIIHSMKLVGARWSFICRPFLVRSFWIGFVSALLADIILTLGMHSLSAFDPAVADFVTLRTLGITAATVLGIGLFMTLTCTVLSVNHYLGKRGTELY